MRNFVMYFIYHIFYFRIIVFQNWVPGISNAVLIGPSTNRRLE